MRGLTIAERRLGIEELCKRLGAPETMVRGWQMGLDEMPDKTFLELVDILTDLEPDFWTHKP
jgi:hypothetical protein